MQRCGDFHDYALYKFTFTLHAAEIGGLCCRDARVHGSGAWCWRRYRTLVRRVNDASRLMYIECNVKRSIWYLVPLRSCSFITRPSLTGDRVTDHVTDANHSVTRHNHQSSSGITGDDRQGRSIICQHGWWGLWNVDQERTPKTRYNY